MILIGAKSDSLDAGRRAEARNYGDFPLQPRRGRGRNQERRRRASRDRQATSALRR